MSDLLELRGVGKRFGAVDVLADVDLAVESGDFVCVVGASGSGKSTLLSMVAGLSMPTSGAILHEGVPVVGPGADRGLVPQAGTLYPWRSVERNVAFGLELLGVDRAERRRRVDWYLAETGLTPWRRTLPGQLSGGQQQRAAIARALACEPDLLLLDEPFGALDIQTKEDMQVLIRRVWSDTGTTVLMVTHDVDEAVFLATRIVVLTSAPGRIATEIFVPLPRDRRLSVKRTAEFHQLRNRVEDLVREQHERQGGSVA